MKNLKKHPLLISILALVLMLSACGKNEETEQNGARQPGTENRENRNPDFGGKPNMNTNEISVVTQAIKLTDVVEYVSISGTLEGINDIAIISEVHGRIVSISKNLGDIVEAGDEIAKIDNEEIELQLTQTKASTLAAKANYESEEIKFQINEELYKKQSISEVEYILAKSSFESAKAAYDGAMANQLLAERAFDNSLFKAPISGKIATLPIKFGEYIPLGTEVATIVDDSKMVIRTGAGPSIIQKIEKNEEVELTTKLSNKTFTGIITGVGLKPGRDNFNYPIVIQAENTQNLLSGQLVSGKIATTYYNDVITVNPSSVISYYDTKFVYVVDTENKVEKREIDILIEVSETCIVQNGLEIGDEVIIQGMDLVKEGSLVTTKKSSSKSELSQLEN
ncbi:MAG: efflux RND transporter periplasmic adaptor subunit [Candidatus Tenebribacter davisii]|nr:efflux RND transporter periplasmic adaptor subunit [Candidatus Tenebribacter davisii]